MSANPSAPAETLSALPSDARGWAALLSCYDDIVLVANSDAVDVRELDRCFGNGTLFVFFNKTYKVLSGRFERPALLVARSSAAGANIVYRREVEVVTRPFASSGFLGILNLAGAPNERLSPLADFGGGKVGFLDLSAHFHGFYPFEKVPSSGFALAVWLAELHLPGSVHLVGFSARRSERWKLFSVHDWTFEQTLLRLLTRNGAVRVLNAVADDNSFGRIPERFPSLTQHQVTLTLAEVLSERLSGTDAAVDRLFSLTRWQAGLDRFLRRMKPRTRKQRLAEGRDGGDRRDGLAKTGGGD